MSENAMSWYVNVKAVLHSAAIVKIIFHPHVIMTTESSKNGAITLYRMKLCG